jgi:predicted DsbA family dithiol-disulfide isomerase
MSTTHKAEGSDIVATVGGEAITAEELAEAAKADLQKIRMKIYQIEKRALDTLVDERLLTQAAKREGVSVENYRKKMIDEKIVEPTEEEIKAVYEARKGKGRFEQPLDDKMKTRIPEYLKATQGARIEKDLMIGLRAQSDVKILMDVPRVEIRLGKAPSKGPKRADVTIIEFSDYQCPFSGKVQGTVKDLISTYGEKVRHVYRDFPLSFHRDAQKAHEAAHCAGDQKKYFEYHDKLFENQQKMKIDDLRKYAKELDLNTKKFNKCLDGGAHVERVRKSITEGQAAGVAGTPAFFINGIMISGAQPIGAFKEIIEGELQKQ